MYISNKHCRYCNYRVKNGFWESKNIEIMNSERN